jgi:two-component system chemotaxis sensor kinase CheA
MAAASKRLRVLVADDSMTTRALEQSVLEAAGYEVITAVDGADAWRQLEAGGADLLVSDIEMPNMDGLALCRAVRASERFANLPVVLVTSLDSPEARERGLAAGADAYVGKASAGQAGLLGTVRGLLA